MSKDEFDSAGDFVAMETLLGELLLFTPTEYVDVTRNEVTGEVTGGGMKTMYGHKDYVVTDIVVPSQPGQPTYDDQTVLQGGLVGKLKRKVAAQRKMLGVLELGEAKRGQKPPYQLATPTDEQKQMARDYLAGRTVAAATEDTAADDDPFAVKA